jgi:solute carrier family 38 (sodium-coupled neutral amino acid transporter), member 6
VDVDVDVDVDADVDVDVDSAEGRRGKHSHRLDGAGAVVVKAEAGGESGGGDSSVGAHTDDDCSDCGFLDIHLSKGSFYVAPTIAFSFVCHTALLPIYSELRGRTPAHMGKVAVVSMGICFGLYLLAGLFGYWAFRGRVETDVLKSFTAFQPHDVPILIARILVAASVTVTVPLINYPFRKAILLTFFPGRDFSWLRHVGVGAATLGFVTAVAIAVPNIRYVFGAAGCTSSVSLVFVLPGLFYATIAKQQGYLGTWTGHRRGAITMLVAGVLVGAISLSGIIMGWVEGFGQACWWGPSR